MSSVNESAEAAPQTSLLDLIAWVRRHWWRVAVSALLCAAVTFVIVRQQPFVYTATTSVVEVEADATTSGRGGTLGGLLSASGLQAGRGNQAERGLALLESRGFIERFITARGLTQKLLEGDDVVRGAPTPMQRERAFERFAGLMDVKKGQGPSDPIRIQITWTDPQEAADWSNDLIRRLNNEMRLRAVRRAQQKKSFLEYELARNRDAELRLAISGMIAGELKALMLARQPQGYTFEVLDAAVPPTKPSGPRFVILTAAGALIGLLIGIAWALVTSAWRRS